MITEEALPRITPQACPFCGEKQEVIFNGHMPTSNPEAPMEIIFDKDRGYSFCDCRNIFFTDWSNMQQASYDKAYEEKYNNETVRQHLLEYARVYFQPIKCLTKGKIFYEIGAVAPFLLNEAKRQGFETFALDIIAHNFQGHTNITGDFEDQNTIIGYPSPDLIWASHIFEHFKDPIAMARRCFDVLKPGGVLFVAMPDPYFIDFKFPGAWGHWHLKEHHILWDMDSFVELMEEIGFKTVMKKRNPTGDFICIGDYHLIFQKEII